MVGLVDLAEKGIDPALPFIHIHKKQAVAAALAATLPDRRVGCAVIRNVFSAEDQERIRDLLGTPLVPFEDMPDEINLKKEQGRAPAFDRLVKFTTYAGAKVYSGYRSETMTIRRYSDKAGVPYHLDPEPFDRITIGLRIGAEDDEELGRLHAINDAGEPVAPDGIPVDRTSLYAFKSAGTYFDWRELPEPFEVEFRDHNFWTKREIKPTDVGDFEPGQLAGCYDTFGVPHAMTDVAPGVSVLFSRTIEPPFIRRWR